MLGLDEVLGLDMSSFIGQLKMKPGIDVDHQAIVEMSNGLWFRGMEFDEEEKPKKQNAKQTKAHLQAMVLRHLTLRIAALGIDAFERGPPMIAKIHAYLVRELNLADNEGEKSAQFVDRMYQTTLESFWTENVRG